MTEPRVLTQEEFWAEARERFGLCSADWAFQCPSCGDVATGAEIAKALAEHPRKCRDFDRNVRFDEVLGQECIGRVLAKGGGRGCQYAAFGLIHGPWQIAIPHSKKPTYCFPLAPAPAGDEEAGQ